jgi:hypothetical protein
MAYGRFGGGGQSNLRAPDAGQERANKKDQERNVTIPKVKLPVKKKKKPVTIFGFKVTAPKSDQEKKVEAGATVIATKSGGRIVTTPTMDNKSLIMSKATQDKTKFDYLRASKNYGSAKPAIGKAISGGQAVRLSQLANKTGGTPATSTRLSQLGSKTGGTPLTAKPNVLSKRTGGALDKDTGIPKVNTAQLQSKTGSSPTLLRGNNQTLKSGGQFGSLQERTFLKTSTKAGRSLANPSIGSSVAKTLSSAGNKVKNFLDPLGKGMPKLGGSSKLSMPSGTSTSVDKINTSTFFDSKTKTPTTTKKPTNIKMVTKSLPSNYTVSSQKKSKPIPIAPKSRLAGADLNTNILSQNIAKSDAKMNPSTYAKEGPEVPVFNVKANKVPASLIRQLRLSTTAGLNAYMVPNVLSTYSKSEQKPIKAEFRKRQGNKNKTKSLLTRLAVGAVM